ncbi:AMSH-like ubiquitin thioesterase 3 [Dioscorea cayenensis subsp. rotundata]|uniref:AMSH-like ubiquitin thioesterase 3 n=1 Tax=Dioscorea cayennensis subsp. rotundata TaxID=55577 RepID=A0AB40CVV3_DIOCR|nr:AMSH-like ubiquitin thioesterase 3 [Dioscorea cayenensis subsp. rotundata]
MNNSPKVVINIVEVAERIEVANGISLSYYYNLSDNLIKQANIYRQQENNIINLYIELLIFASLITETIPYHKDYKFSLKKEKLETRKKLLSVLEELERLKPHVQLLVSELKRNSANHVTYGQVHHDVSAEINRNSTNQAVVSVGQLHCHDSSNDKFQQTQKLLDEIADMMETLKKKNSESSSIQGNI